MDSSSISSRLSSIKNSVTLAQTDTTVGFLSQDPLGLYEAKQRETSKSFLKLFTTFKEAKDSAPRVYSKYKKRVRRSKNTTFISSSRAFRVAKLPHNSAVLRQLSWHYSTSANRSGDKFDIEYCTQRADIVVLSQDGLHERESSKLIKLGKTRCKRLR